MDDPEMDVSKMDDKMKLLSVEVTTVPRIRKSTSPTEVQPSQESERPSKEEIENFEISSGQFHAALGIIVWMVMAFCWLSPYFTGSKIPKTCADPMKNLRNIYDQNFSFDFYAFISENETDFDPDHELIWRMSNLTYGDLQSTFSRNVNVSISERIRNNRNLYLHVRLTKSGFPPGAKRGDSWADLYTIRKTKRLNFDWQADGDFSVPRSYWRSNWTVDLVNMIDDQELTLWRKENELVDCDPLTRQYYPILYLNDKFNLANDCILINQTTESLPLNLNFKQIDIDKLRNYLEQSDFEEYLKHSNEPYEDVIRRNLIASDFEKRGAFHLDHFRWIMVAIILAKCAILVLELVNFGDSSSKFVKDMDGAWLNLKNKLFGFWSNRNAFVKVLLAPFGLILLGLCAVALALGTLLCISAPLAVLFYFYLVAFPLVALVFCGKPEDDQGEKDGEASIEILVEQPKQLNQKIEANTNCCRLDRQVIHQNLIAFVLLPLLALYPWFSSYRLDFPEENLAIFALLALSNCFVYLNSIHWKGRYFLDFGPRDESCYPLLTFQAVVYFLCQLMVLSAILHYVPLVNFSFPAFLIFTFAWLLSDLATMLCLFDLQVVNLENLENLEKRSL